MGVRHPLYSILRESPLENDWQTNMNVLKAVHVISREWVVWISRTLSSKNPQTRKNICHLKRNFFLPLLLCTPEPWPMGVSAKGTLRFARLKTRKASHSWDTHYRYSIKNSALNLKERKKESKMAPAVGQQRAVLFCFLFAERTLTLPKNCDKESRKDWNDWKEPLGHWLRNYSF